MDCLKNLRRFLAGIVAFTFFATNTLTPTPSAYAANVESPSFVSSFKIPAEFGKVTDIFLGTRDSFLGTRSTKNSNESRVLIHIQEAHANYDAQKNIRNILEYLSQNYGIKLVLLEGAGNKLQPELFRFFPQDAELQQAVNDKLMEIGELNGAEVFMIENTGLGARPLGLDKTRNKNESLVPSDESRSESVAAFGVENTAAYVKNLASYREVFEGRKIADDFLGAFYTRWQRSADLSMNKSLREFLGRETAFEEDRVPLQDWLESLKKTASRELELDLDNVRVQNDWPVLVRYFRLKQIAPKINAAKARQEKEVFLQDLKARRIPSELLQEITKLLEHKKDGDLPPYKTRFAFEKLMDLLPTDYSFEQYPNFKLHLQQLILLSELQSDQLQEEIAKLTEKLTVRLTQTENDKQLVAVLHDYRLVKKLFQLELNRGEYQQLLSRNVSPANIIKGLGTSSSGLGNPGKTRSESRMTRLELLYGTAIRFYEGAIEREHWMMQKALERMRERKQAKAVLITGGFHTDGFREKILAGGSSYIGITPRIGEITADSQKNYIQTLLGLNGTSASHLGTRKNEEQKQVPSPESRVPVAVSDIAATPRSDIRLMAETGALDHSLSRIEAASIDIVASTRPENRETYQAQLTQGIQTIKDEVFSGPTSTVRAEMRRAIRVEIPEQVNNALNLEQYLRSLLGKAEYGTQNVTLEAIAAGEWRIVLVTQKGETIPTSNMALASSILSEKGYHNGIRDLQAIEFHPRSEMRERILLVDDSESDRALFRVILESKKYEVVVVESAEEALEEYARAKKEGKPFAAVVSDWNMPKMKGDELARRITDVPFILQSSNILEDGTAENPAEQKILDELAALNPFFRTHSKNELGFLAEKLAGLIFAAKPPVLSFLEMHSAFTAIAKEAAGNDDLVKFINDKWEPFLTTGPLTKTKEKPLKTGQDWQQYFLKLGRLNHDPDIAAEAYRRFQAMVKKNTGKELPPLREGPRQRSEIRTTAKKAADAKRTIKNIADYVRPEQGQKKGIGKITIPYYKGGVEISYRFERLKEKKKEIIEVFKNLIAALELEAEEEPEIGRHFEEGMSHQDLVGVFRYDLEQNHIFMLLAWLKALGFLDLSPTQQALLEKMKETKSADKIKLYPRILNIDLKVLKPEVEKSSVTREAEEEDLEPDANDLEGEDAEARAEVRASQPAGKTGFGIFYRFKLALAIGIIGLWSAIMARAQTVFPGKPYLEHYAGLSGSGSIAQYSSAHFKWNFRIWNPGYSLAVYNFGTTAQGPQNLSGYTSFSWDVRSYINNTTGHQGVFRVEFKDTDGDIASKTVSGIYSNYQTVTITLAELLASNPAYNPQNTKEIVWVADSNAYMPDDYEGWAEFKTGGLFFTTNISPNASYTLYDTTELPEGTEGAVDPVTVYPVGASVTASNQDHGIAFTYNTGGQTWAGAGMAFDDFGTVPVGTGDLSGFSNLVFGIKATGTTQLKMEIVDSAENKEYVYLNGMNAGYQTWVIPMSFFAGIDLENVKVIYFIVEGAGKSGTVSINHIPETIDITGVRRQQNNDVVTFSSISGLTYRVDQSAAGLVSPNWQTGATTRALGPSATITNSTGSSSNTVVTRVIYNRSEAREEKTPAYKIKSEEVSVYDPSSPKSEPYAVAMDLVEEVRISETRTVYFKKAAFEEAYEIYLKGVPNALGLLKEGVRTRIGDLPFRFIAREGKLIILAEKPGIVVMKKIPQTEAAIAKKTPLAAKAPLRIKKSELTKIQGEGRSRSEARLDIEKEMFKSFSELSSDLRVKLKTEWSRFRRFGGNSLEKALREDNEAGVLTLLEYYWEFVGEKIVPPDVLSGKVSMVALSLTGACVMGLVGLTEIPVHALLINLSIWSFIAASGVFAVSLAGSLIGNRMKHSELARVDHLIKLMRELMVRRNHLPLSTLEEKTLSGASSGAPVEAVYRPPRMIQFSEPFVEGERPGKRPPEVEPPARAELRGFGFDVPDWAVGSASNYLKLQGFEETDLRDAKVLVKKRSDGMVYNVTLPSEFSQPFDALDTLLKEIEILEVSQISHIEVESRAYILKHLLAIARGYDQEAAQKAGALLRRLNKPHSAAAAMEEAKKLISSSRSEARAAGTEENPAFEKIRKAVVELAFELAQKPWYKVPKAGEDFDAMVRILSEHNQKRILGIVASRIEQFAGEIRRSMKDGSTWKMLRSRYETALDASRKVSGAPSSLEELITEMPFVFVDRIVQFGKAQRPLEERLAQAVEALAEIQRGSYGLENAKTAHELETRLSRRGSERFMDVLESAEDFSRAVLSQRSEVRDNTNTIDGYTVVSRQLEAGLDRSILEALNKKLSRRFPNLGHMIRRYVGLVAETTLTGGLGALMHDLFPAWGKNFGSQEKREKDLVAINVVYESIKGQRYAKYLPAEIQEGRKTLGDYLRGVLKSDKSLSLSFELEIGDDFRRKAADEERFAASYGSAEYRVFAHKAKQIIGQKIYVEVYPTETHFGRVPNYYVDAYFIDNEGEKISIFDEVYPDAPHGHPNLWRDVHMAVYSLASQHLLEKLRRKGVVKSKFLFVDNEVFVSTPTPLFPDAIHHHVNHTVFRPGLYMPDEASYEMLGFPEVQRKYIVKDGKINIIDAVGISSHLITGVALYEHTPVLAKDIMAAHVHKLESYNKEGVRNTNGVYLEQWQSPLLTDLISQYKAKIGLEPEDSNQAFYREIQKTTHARILEEFEEKAEFIKAVHAAELLLWLKEDQNYSLWFDEMLEAFQGQRGVAGGEWHLDIADAGKFVEGFRQAVQDAVIDPAGWQHFKAGPMFFLKELLLREPIISNVRRQVSYKGPDKWLEILRKLQRDPHALAQFKENAPRVILGGREFGEEAHGMFLEIQGLIRALGLQDRFATVDDYNNYIAPIIFQGVSGSVMLSDEFLEASATSMMKAIANGAALIGVWGGADPEIFTIVDHKTKRELDVFKDHVTHDELVKNLRTGAWKITNGFLIEYSSQENSTQPGGGRRPSADSLLRALLDLNEQYQDPEARRRLQFNTLASSLKVDMAEGQALAHKMLWEEAIRILQEEDKVFEGLKISQEDSEALLSRSIRGQGIVDFIEEFRYLRMKGRESYDRVAFYATQGLQGSIFGFLNEFFKDFDHTLEPVIRKIHELSVRAETTTNLQEKVIANLEALEIVERLTVEVSVALFEHYVLSGDKALEPYLAKPIIRENLARYFDEHAVALESIAKKIPGYTVSIGDKNYLVALNLGEFSYVGPSGEKARGDFYGEEGIKALIGEEAAKNDASIFQLVDAITDQRYGTYPVWKMMERFPIGVPYPGVQVLRVEDTGQQSEEKETRLRNDILHYLEALANNRLVSDGKPITQLLLQKIQTVVEDPAKLSKMLKVVANLSREEAIVKFTRGGVPAVMAFIAILSPELLEDVKHWNPDVYKKLNAVIQDPAFEKNFKEGKIWFHKVDRDSALVISRNLPGQDIPPVIVPIHFPDRPYRADDGKAWFRLLDVRNLGVENSDKIEYQVYDAILQKAYEPKTGAKLHSEKWHLGVPVEGAGYRFQILQVQLVSAARSETRGVSNEETEEWTKHINDWIKHTPEKVLILGLGFVGLTKLVLGVTDHGWDAVGLEIVPSKANMISQGGMPFFADMMEPEYDKEGKMKDPGLLQTAIESGRFHVTSSYDEALKDPERDIIFLAVQTPQSNDGRADTFYLEYAVREVARRTFSYPRIIVGKSTAPPKTTVEKLRISVEEARAERMQEVFIKQLHDASMQTERSGDEAIFKLVQGFLSEQLIKQKMVLDSEKSYLEAVSREDWAGDVRRTEKKLRTIHRDNPENIKTTLDLLRETIGEGKFNSLFNSKEILDQTIPIEFAWEPEFLREGKEVVDDRGEAGRIVIGAENLKAAQKVKALYEHYNPNLNPPRQQVPIVITDLASAQTVKYAANTYRAIKISFINYIGWLCQVMGYDVNKIADIIGIEGNVRRAFLNASLGFGGSCFPKDLAAFVKLCRELGLLPNLVLDALAVNEVQIRRFVNLIVKQLDGVKDKTIVVLGGAFKPETSDTRDSRAVRVMQDLLQKGAKIRVVDPKAIPELQRMFKAYPPGVIEYFENLDDFENVFKEADGIVLATEWEIFRDKRIDPKNGKMDFEKIAALFTHRQSLPHIFDGRNLFERKAVKEFGFSYIDIGRAELLKSDKEHVAFAKQVKEVFLAGRVSHINDVAELAEKTGANALDIRKGFGLDPVVGESYLDPGIGWGGHDLVNSLRALEKQSWDNIKDLLDEYREARKDFMKQFGFSENEFPDDENRVPFVTASREINKKQIGLYLNKVKTILGPDLNGKDITLIGLAYKIGTYSLEESPSIHLIEALLQEGAIVHIADENLAATANTKDYFSRFQHGKFVENIRLYNNLSDAIVNGKDLQVLVNLSERYSEESEWAKLGLKKVLDARHFFNDPVSLKKTGISYFALGIPEVSLAEEEVLRQREMESRAVLSQMQKAIVFYKDKVMIEEREDETYKVTAFVKIEDSWLQRADFYIFYGPYPHERQTFDWYAQEVLGGNIRKIEQTPDFYQIKLIISPKNNFPAVEGRYGLTLFAVPKTMAETDPGFRKVRLWAAKPFDDTPFIVRRTERSELRSPVEDFRAEIEAGKVTFIMFKEDAVRGRNEEGLMVPQMLERLRDHGFELVYLGAQTEFTQEQAREFYAVHQGKWFYEPLVQYITSGPAIPALVRYHGEGPAVQAIRSILPSLRQEFGIEKGDPELKKVERNKIHASDSPENVFYEGAIAFRSELRTLDVEALVATIAEPVSAIDLFKKIGQNSALRQIRALKEQIIKASSEFNQSKRQAEEVQEIGDLGLKIAKLLSQENYSPEKTQGILQKAVSELSEALGLILRLLTYAATANTKSIQPSVSVEAQKMVKKIEAAMERPAREKKATETASPRSELRNVAALIATGVEVRTPEEFFRRNLEQGGGHEQGVRSVTEKVMDGIYSLLAHSFDAAKVISSAFFPEAYAQEMLTMASKPEMFLTKMRFAAAKAALGIKTFSAGDVLVIGRGFALEQGAIAAVRTVFGDIPVLIYTDQAEDVGFLEQLNVQLAQAHRPPVLVARNPDEARKLLDEEAARLRQAGVSSIHFKAMVYEAETLPEALRKQLSDVTVVTSRMFKHFLNLAGSRIAALAQEVQVKFAFARSA